MNLNETIWHRFLHRPYRLHAYDHGGDGPVIIFLHGIAASSSSWDKLIPLLNARYRCVSIDLLGFGDSPKPQWHGYSLEDHLFSVHKTIRTLGIRGPFVLAGHSLGSLLATRYACLWPKKVSRLLLLSPPVYPPLDSITSRVARTHNGLLLRIYRYLRSREPVNEQIKRLSYLLPLPRSVIRNPDTWVPFCRTLERCIEQQTIAEDISDIGVPVDIFYGTIDQLIVPHNIRQLASPTVKIHGLRGAGHDISKRYAATVAKLLIGDAATD